MTETTAPTLVRRQYLMGTICEIQAFEGLVARAERSLSAAFDEIARIENVLSVHRETSEVARINRDGGRGAVAVSEELMGLLGLAERFSGLLDGAFDVTAGHWTRFWNLTENVPDPCAVEALRERTGRQKVTLDRVAGRVFFEGEGVSLNFGAMGKGYALDQAANVLRRFGTPTALLNFGGQILTLGGGLDDGGWPVSIASPRNRFEPLLTIRLTGGSVATTSQGERGRALGGRRFGHVIDPRTGWPVDSGGSVSVLAPTAAEADALSTGLFVLGPDRGLGLARRWEPAVSAVFVVPEAGGWRCRYTDNFERCLAGQTANALAG